MEIFGGHVVPRKIKLLLWRSSGRGSIPVPFRGTAQHLVGWYFDRTQEGDQFSWRLSASCAFPKTQCRSTVHFLPVKRVPPQLSCEAVSLFPIVCGFAAAGTRSSRVKIETTFFFEWTPPDRRRSRLLVPRSSSTT